MSLIWNPDAKVDRPAPMQIGEPIVLQDGRTVRPLAIWEGRMLVVEFLGHPDRPEELREWIDLPLPYLNLPSPT